MNAGMATESGMKRGLTDYTSQIALQGYSMELVRKITLLKAVFLSVLHARRQIAY